MRIVPDRGDEKAITRDLLASNIDVLIGAGRRLEKESSEGGSYRDAFGRRGYAVAGSLEEAEPVRAGRLLCAVTDENIPKTIRREDYPRCATQKALEILSHNADSVGRGFVLMVEGSLIDGASHGNDAEKILAEMRDFERAVAAAMDFADRTPGTLVVVTADHETRGSPSRAATVILPAPRAVSDNVFRIKSHAATSRPRLPLWYGCGAYCWDNGQPPCPAGHGAAREGE
ncbi:MAG: alkaline phosphatase [Alistipes onderdonkii]